LKRVLVFYSHFSPAYKAGGPIQSLTNLVKVLKEDYSFFIVCSARDMSDSKLLDGVNANKWNNLDIGATVFYADGLVGRKIDLAFKECDPDIVYINGLYSPAYNWLPLWFAKRQKRKVIVAPRGMLQKGALTIKPIKKKMFLAFFKWLGFHKNIRWHATDEQEKTDVKHIFGDTAVVDIAMDIPRQPKANVAKRSKEKGQLRMVYLSLIAEKKNLHLVLKALKDIKIAVQFDIYGPVKDSAYWKQCERLMEDQVHTIRYLGVLTPLQVQDVLSDYHVFVLPTKGENFGHAIYEALSVGTPVLISPFTPWGQVQDCGAGITAHLDINSLVLAIESFIWYDEQEFSMLSLNAHKLAVDYFYKNDFRNQYRNLFT
jgi:glycosyltransferase involved in cell wall biosynthesis